MLTIVEAAQTHWRAAAWLMKNYQPHESVERRKRKQRRRESQRDSKEFFATAFDSMKTEPDKESEFNEVKRPRQKRGQDHHKNRL